MGHTRNTKIVGDKVILVPYEAKHVEKYHNWMKDPVLQDLTASLPLSLEEEFEMQKSWQIDQNKCTFIILDRVAFQRNQNEIEAMVGDTNLFFHPKECEPGALNAEAEIMIAELAARGKHFGWEAMLLMLKFSSEKIKGLSKYQVKIAENNNKSIAMFEKMQFTEVERSKVFKEVTFERPITVEWMAWLNDNIKSYSEESYE